tara:strand:+ start:82880 stop:84556 length:1677 start_codon:yes stop_codon:yes gene_type:complete
MKVGIDFDNTIVCYEKAYEAIAKREKIKIPQDKSAREVLKSTLSATEGGNLRWTQLQGELYGHFIKKAKPFPEVKEFLKSLKEAGIPYCIISHKSRYPAIGSLYPFREAALNWLRDCDLLEDEEVGFQQEHCFWENSQEEKIGRIALEGCTHFIDDLPEFLSREEFPDSISRILFSPGKEDIADGPFYSFSSWSEIKEHLLNEPAQEIKSYKTAFEYNELSEDEVRGRFETLLKRSFDAELTLCERLYQGGNNQGYRIKDGFGRTFFGKRYYRFIQDKRDRLNHEYAFLSVLKKNPHLPCAKALLRDDLYGMALYSFIEGCTPQDAISHHWEQCLHFFEEMQVVRNTNAAKELPVAAESAWSLAQHLGFVQRRRDEWLHLASLESLSKSIQELVSNELEPLYQVLAENLLADKDFNTLWPRDAAVLSPSDFGLHNALEDKEGNLSFIDFEYAGWDDPAKVVADFFCQVAVRAPGILYESFVERTATLLPEAYQQAFMERLPKVEQCIRLKWCYILLNPLHPNAQAKQHFVKRPVDVSAQLDKVQAAIQRCKIGTIAYA